MEEEFDVNDNNIKAFYKSKTILFAILVAIFGVLQLNVDILKDLLSPQMYGIVFLVISVVVAVLRVITTTAVVTSVITTTEKKDSTQ